MKKINLKLLTFLFGLLVLIGCNRSPKMKILVFSKTEGFRHASIEPGQEAIKKMAAEKNFDVAFTENSEEFYEKNLGQYHAVIFLNTTGDILNAEQQEAFERYIQAGGGYVGIHSATDTEYDWPWYGQLAGAYFLDHPSVPSNVQKGKFTVVDSSHISTKHMNKHFEHTDEFYSFKNMSKDVKHLLTIDEKSYQGGNNPDFHPMAWYHEFDGGRSWYTALGHTDESFSDPMFLSHLWGGIVYATGGDDRKNVDFSKAKPEENRFTKVVLADKLDEPMELSVLDENRILFIQRKGEVMLYNNATSELKEIAKIPVSTHYTNKEGKVSVAEDGLLGLSKDPNFEKNNWIYMFYSTPERSSNVLARFELKGETLDLNSKKELLEVPVQREECCHTAGSIAWDKEGNLYLSTGDNTNPHGSNGYSPSDERPGRASWDAQKSSANTNDLRGKILRIKPEADGTYNIPEGNLFPKGTPKTRPEIYTMGHRNPFRISVDQKNGYVYWGDVGPDANAPTEGRGPAGHDEVGQARKAGNFGWPHFVGNNKAYNKFDFEKNISLEKWNEKSPKNTSPNNTGLEDLPPAQNAFIWYPYGPSPEFSLMGSGGRNAMAGPVYYQELFKNAERAFPSYYDGKLFAYEWMRGFIMAVTMDKNGDFKSMERFLPNTLLSNPMDMEFAKNGDLYMLEYGTGWFTQNDNARLVRIEYNKGNRIPQVKLNADKSGGALPLQVKLDAKGTKDLDRDELSYIWTVTSKNGFKKEFKTEEVTLDLKDPGVYNVSLSVKDGKGGEGKAQYEIIAGNDLPKVKINFENASKSFYTPGQTVKYAVEISDKEDGILGKGISEDEVSFTVDYLPEGFDKIAIAQGHQSADKSTMVAKGKTLIDKSDCKSCHAIDKKSVGPMYKEVAKKYASDSKAIDYLSNKIIKGGSGVWGEIAMAAHPTLSKEDASEMAKYIMSLNTLSEESKTPLKGTYTYTFPKDDAKKGIFIMRSSYTDKGANGLSSLKSDETLVLRNANLDIHSFDSESDVMKMTFSNQKILIAQKDGAYVSLKDIDLNNISKIQFLASAPTEQLNAAGGYFEVRVGSPTGALIGKTTDVKPGGSLASINPAIANLEISKELLQKNQDLYFVFKNDAVKNKSLYVIISIMVQ